MNRCLGRLSDLSRGVFKPVVTSLRGPTKQIQWPLPAQQSELPGLGNGEKMRACISSPALRSCPVGADKAAPVELHVPGSHPKYAVVLLNRFSLVTG